MNQNQNDAIKSNLMLLISAAKVNSEWLNLYWLLFKISKLNVFIILFILHFESWCHTLSDIQAKFKARSMVKLDYRFMLWPKPTHFFICVDICNAHQT